MKLLKTIGLLICITLPVISFSLLNGVSSVLSYTPYTPITITSNSDFVAYGFPGSGTENDPYIIEGYNITTTEVTAISIDGSISVKFIIRNCYLRANSYGIFIRNIASDTAKIESNSIEKANTAGIFIYSTSLVEVENNTLISNKHGIELFYVSSVNVSHNSFISNFDIGLAIYNSPNFTIFGNNITSNKLGIEIGSSEGSIRQNFIAYNEQDGLVLNNGVSENNIVNNTFISNQNYAINLAGDMTENIMISYNTFINDSVFISPNVNLADTITITNNLVNGKPIGYFINQDDVIIEQEYGQLIFINCTNIKISNYNFENVDNAIFAKECDNATIENINITQSFIAGVIIKDSNNIALSNNTLMQVNTAIELKSTNKSRIIQNDITAGKVGLKITTDVEMNMTLEAQYNTFKNLTVGIEAQKRYSNGNVIDNFTITDNYFRDIENDAIHLICIQSVIILRNNAENVGKFAFLDEKYSFQITNSIIRIKSNTIESVTQGYSFYLIEAVGDNTIDDNIMLDSALALWAYDSSNILYSNNDGGSLNLHYNQNISISDNNILGGISIDTASEIVIAENDIRNGDKAINIYKVANITVYKNNIINFSSNGIEGASVSNLNISFNYIGSCPKGIEFYGALSNYLTNIEISKNNFVNITYGVFMRSATPPENISIEYNTIITSNENDATGIYILDSGGTKLILRDNSIISAYRAIYLRDNWDNVIIENNYLKTYSTAGSAILILITSSNNIRIINNTLISDKKEDSYTITALIKLDGTQNAIICNNKFLAKDFYQEYAFYVAIDNGINNQWYNATSKIGNYWMNYYKTDPYTINGSAGAQDLYPIIATDTDGDGLDDIIEQFLVGTSYINVDTDSDGIPDGFEVLNGLDPLLNDANQDPDNDNLTNVQEYQNNTNPYNADTDFDGMPDGWEVKYGLDPLTDDSSDDLDNDGLPNIQEYNLGTDPGKADTDGDGYSDNEEIIAGTDPTDPNSHPLPTTEEGTYFLLIGVMGAIIVAVIIRKKE